MNTFLPPIEKPASFALRLAYFFARRQFGTVPTPLKVFGPRLPLSFGSFYGRVGKLDRKLRLTRELALLIRQQVARVNLCLFCLDIGRWFALKEATDPAKFDALDAYATSPLFTAAERAALDYATELTREKKVLPETFARLRGHFSEREICEIVWLVASEHLYNLTNIGLSIHSDGLCELAPRK